MIGIYKITNLINNKVYIGQSINLNERRKRHFRDMRYHRHSNSHLQNSYDKYGEENMRFEIIQECKDREELNYYETYWFEYYCKLLGRDNTYNLGQTGNAHNTSLETRRKMSENGKGRHLSEQAKEKLKKANLGKVGYWSGKKRSEEFKKKISQKLKGHSGWNKGKHLSEEHRKKISESSKGKPGTRFSKDWTIESRKKLSLANKGNKKCANSGSFKKNHIYHSKKIKGEN